jgi:hypothetical protein
MNVVFLENFVENTCSHASPSQHSHSPAYSRELQFRSTQPQLPITPGVPLLLQFAAISAHCSAAKHVILPPQPSGKSTPQRPLYCPLQDLAMQPHMPLLQIPAKPRGVLQVMPLGRFVVLQRPVVGMQLGCWQVEVLVQLQR